MHAFLWNTRHGPGIKDLLVYCSEPEAEQAAPKDRSRPPSLSARKASPEDVETVMQDQAVSLIDVLAAAASTEVQSIPHMSYTVNQSVGPNGFTSADYLMSWHHKSCFSAAMLQTSCGGNKTAVPVFASPHVCCNTSDMLADKLIQEDTQEGTQVGTQEGKQALDSLEAFLPPDSCDRADNAAAAREGDSDSDVQLSDAEEPPASESNVSPAHVKRLFDAIEDKSPLAESAPQADAESAEKPVEDGDMALTLAISLTSGATQVSSSTDAGDCLMMYCRCPVSSCNCNTQIACPGPDAVCRLEQADMQQISQSQPSWAASSMHVPVNPMRSMPFDTRRSAMQAVGGNCWH